MPDKFLTGVVKFAGVGLGIYRLFGEKGWKTYDGVNSHEDYDVYVLWNLFTLHILNEKRKILVLCPVYFNFFLLCYIHERHWSLEHMDWKDATISWDEQILPL